MSQGDLPVVLLLGFNRPELLQKRVFELSEAGVSSVYVSIDAPVDPDSEMSEFLATLPEIFNDSVQVEVKINQTNMGLAKHVTTRIDELLKLHEEIIILEDDIKINRNFLVNLKAGLELLGNSPSSGIVSGFSPITKPSKLNVTNAWRSTPYFNCWGWACNREAWKGYALDISKNDIAIELSQSTTWEALSKWQKHLWFSRFRKIQNFPDHTWDIQFQYLCFRKSMINLAPVFTLCDNEGFDDPRSAHTKESKPRWWGRGPIYEEIFTRSAPRALNYIFVKLIEPLTTAGDSQLVRIRNKLKN